MKKYLPENLKYLLTVHNMNNTDLANRLNISPQAVGKWLNPNNDALPSIENLIIIADIFGTTLDEILTTNIQTKEGAKEKDMTVPERIDSAIMALERLKNEIKKKEAAILELLGMRPSSNGSMSTRPGIFGA